MVIPIPVVPLLRSIEEGVESARIDKKRIDVEKLSQNDFEKKWGKVHNVLIMNTQRI